MFRLDDLAPPVLPRVEPNEVHVPEIDPFPVLEDDRVRITATLVDHYMCVPAYAYRIDSDYGSVVVSGDPPPAAISSG